jgi:hypothetical protein
VGYQKYNSGFLYSGNDSANNTKASTHYKTESTFSLGRKSLQRAVKSLGYKWRKCQSKRKILVERADVVDWRSRYLVKIKEYRNKGLPIFYTGESWVNTNLTFRKCWQNKEVMGVQTNVNSGNRLTTLHMGGINGFLPNAELIYRAGSATGYYHVQMKVAGFEKWVIKNIDPYSSPSVGNCT